MSNPGDWILRYARLVIYIFHRKQIFLAATSFSSLLCDPKITVSEVFYSAILKVCWGFFSILSLVLLKFEKVSSYAICTCSCTCSSKIWSILTFNEIVW
jgi:hypothetical protein